MIYVYLYDNNIFKILLNEYINLFIKKKYNNIFFLKDNIFNLYSFLGRKKNNKELLIISNIDKRIYNIINKKEHAIDFIIYGDIKIKKFFNEEKIIYFNRDYIIKNIYLSSKIVFDIFKLKSIKDINLIKNFILEKYKISNNYYLKENEIKKNFFLFFNNYKNIKISSIIDCNLSNIKYFFNSLRIFIKQNIISIQKDRYIKKSNCILNFFILNNKYQKNDIIDILFNLIYKIDKILNKININNYFFLFYCFFY